jgi:hypothetical protein
MLAARAATEVGSDHEETRICPGRLIENELGPRCAVRAAAQIEEKPVAQTAAVDALEKLLGHDGVGIDVGQQQWRRDACHRVERLHLCLQRAHVGEAACDGGGCATIAGLIRCVLPPALAAFKFRLVLDAHRSPAQVHRRSWLRTSAARLAPFKPAARKMRCRPSAPACSCTAVEPGTTMARTPGATRRPRATRAAARRSSMRPLVHEPMKARSILMSCRRVPGASAM